MKSTRRITRIIVLTIVIAIIPMIINGELLKFQLPIHKK